ncbi:MAG: UvrD-helicase domain-containing protein, partial [Pseudomonadota bacterium]
GVLDFDDLIIRARDLLARPGLADWVLYKLDGGIDHLLVDEAQDTSPRQWDIVRLLTQEFTAGLGTRSDVPRTLFVVGDKKQSIYSFQGADPEGFDRMRDHFEDRFTALDARFASRELLFSFRSAPAILEAVDATFSEGNTDGVGDVKHRAFKTTLPGRVDVWPFFESTKASKEDPWDAPLDRIGEEHHTRQLAEAIADEIARMTNEEVLWSETGESRRVTEGDVMILFQQRNQTFHEVIRACKSRGLAIAGADVLKLADELAVRDLMALLRFLLTPEDDLSLAAALRSPLFGWSEDRLFRLAHPRGKSTLWVALQKTSDPDDPTLTDLTKLLGWADFLRPYDLLSRILIRMGGRRRLLARLGEDTEDAIDSLLYRALAFETEEPPSLSGFIAWFDSGEIDVRRQAERGAGKIRVMTVHGAKGLESPIVILPDTVRSTEDIKAAIIPGVDGPPVMKVAQAERIGPVADAATLAQQRQTEERQRLLYVAMTRAEQWLIICGAGKSPGEQSWHGQVTTALNRSGAEQCAFPPGHGLRLETVPWPDAPSDMAATSLESMAREDLPSWSHDVVTETQPRAVLISPSELGGAKVLPGEIVDGRDGDTARAHGTAVHTLL